MANSIRQHSSDDMDGLGELAEVTEPVAVVIRPDSTVDVYGCVAVVDQRPSDGLVGTMHYGVHIFAQRPAGHDGESYVLGYQTTTSGPEYVSWLAYTDVYDKQVFTAGHYGRDLGTVFAYYLSR